MAQALKAGERKRARRTEPRRGRARLIAPVSSDAVRPLLPRLQFGRMTSSWRRTMVRLGRDCLGPSKARRAARYTKERRAHGAETGAGTTLSSGFDRYGSLTPPSAPIWANDELVAPRNGRREVGVDLAILRSIGRRLARETKERARRTEPSRGRALLSAPVSSDTVRLLLPRLQFGRIVSSWRRGTAGGRWGWT